MRSRRKPMSTENGLLAIGILTVKSFILSIAFGMMLLFAMFHIKTAMAADLKALSTVNNDLLRVGDVFDNVSGKSDIVIGHAPAPGHEMRLNARTLMRLAHSLDISWQPNSVLDEVVIRREGTMVAPDAVADALKSELKSKGIGDNLDIVYDSAAPRLTVSSEEDATVEIGGLHYNPQDGRFDAIAYAPSIANPIRQAKISGTAYKMVDVPVFKQKMNIGDIINASDITTLPMREKFLPRGALLDVADLQGMALAKPVNSEQPIRNLDVALPQLVERGNELTIVYKAGAMNLTAKGKALQDGAKGEIIRILNLASNKNLQGMVTATGEVTVY